MAVVLQEPYAARRAHAGVAFVEDDFFGLVDPAQFEYMVIMYMKALTGVAGVYQAQAEEIEMTGAGDVALGKIFRRTDVDDAEIRRAEFFSASRDGDEQGSRLFAFR